MKGRCEVKKYSIDKWLVRASMIAFVSIINGEDPFDPDGEE